MNSCYHVNAAESKVRICGSYCAELRVKPSHGRQASAESQHEGKFRRIPRRRHACSSRSVGSINGQGTRGVTDQES